MNILLKSSVVGLLIMEMDRTYKRPANFLLSYLVQDKILTFCNTDIVRHELQLINYLVDAIKNINKICIHCKFLLKWQYMVTCHTSWVFSTEALLGGRGGPYSLLPSHFHPLLYRIFVLAHAPCSIDFFGFCLLLP